MWMRGLHDYLTSLSSHITKELTGSQSHIKHIHAGLNYDEELCTEWSSITVFPDKLQFDSRLGKQHWVRSDSPSSLFCALASLVFCVWLMLLYTKWEMWRVVANLVAATLLYKPRLLIHRFLKWKLRWETVWNSKCLGFPWIMILTYSGLAATQKGEGKKYI